MGKRPFLSMASGLIGGICIALYGKIWMLWAGVCGELVLTAILRGYIWKMPEHDRERIWRHRCFVTLLLTVALFFGWHHCRAVQIAENQYLPYLEDGEEIRFAGKISAKERKNEQYFYYMSACQIGQGSKIRKQQEIPAKVIVYCESDTYSIGQTLVLHGKIKLFSRASNDGNFDQEAYYRARGISFAIRDVKVRSVYGKENRFGEKLYQWKCRLAQIYGQALGIREGGVLNTMLLGEKTLLDEEVKQLYRASGISHILAISGLHISLIGMTFYRLLRRCRLGFWEAGLLAAALMLSYGWMAGMGYSVIRAVGMFCILLLAQAAGRSYDSLNAMGFAAVFILWRNPYALCDAGLQFSFIAVTGVVWAGKIVQNAYQGHAMLQKIGVGFVLQLVMLPVTAWYFFEIPVYAMFINMLVLPFAGIVLAAGIAGGLFGFFMVPQTALAVPIDMAVMEYPGLAWRWKLVRVLLLPCRVILQAYEKICVAVSKLPNAEIITGKPSGWRIVVYYLLLMAGLCLLWSVAKRREEIIIPFLFGCCLLVFLFMPFPQGMKLAVLDVGQGDGIYLRTDSGYHVFFDGGSTSVQSVGKYRILPYLKANGVKAVDYWVVTHTDQDHVSGLFELLEEGYPVRNLVVFKGMVQDENYGKMVSLAREHGVKICAMSRKNCLHLGGAELTAVSPEYRAGDEQRSEESADKNEESLVLLYEEDGFSALFTGDIGESQEKQILNRGEIHDVDFYKVAHHGSKYSNSKEWLETLSPRIAVISCAKKNRYGHPGEEAVKHIKDAGSALFYTMKDGQITVTRKKKNWIVAQKYLEPDKQFVFAR